MPPTTAKTVGHPIPNYIEGSWVASSGTDTLPVEDPTTRDVLHRVPLSTPAETTCLAPPSMTQKKLRAWHFPGGCRSRWSLCVPIDR